MLEADEGQYECQVSTEAKLSSVFNVKVVRPQVSWNLYLDLNLIMMDRDFIIEYGMVRRVLFLPRDGNILPLYYRASSPQQALYYHIILLLHCNTVTLSHCISLLPDGLVSLSTNPAYSLDISLFYWDI